MGDHPWQDNAPAEDYTVDELMVAVLASWFDNSDEVVNGMASAVPVCAFALARLTHAPELTWVAAGIGVDPREFRLPRSTLEAPLWQDAVAYLDHYRDFWHLVQGERHFRKFCVGAAQVDRYGNANNSMLGDDVHAPRRRLPGTAGLGDMGSLGKQLYFWQPRHSPRTLVERVDFVSCAGYLRGGDERERLGLAGGPQCMVTNLAVLDFEPVTRRMRLLSVHPGVGVEQVQDATGFELALPDNGVTRTPAPTRGQVRLLRDVIDPEGVRRYGFDHA